METGWPRGAIDAEWLFASAPSVISHVADFTAALNAFAKAQLVTISIGQTGHTGVVHIPDDAERGVISTARVVQGITLGAGVVYANRVPRAAIVIVPTGDTGVRFVIDQAERRVLLAAAVIGRVTHTAASVNALPCVKWALPILLTTDALGLTIAQL